MTITKDKVVSINYTLKDADGNELDSSKNTEPLEYLHGNGQLIPGLEMQLEGKTKGEKLSAVVEPKDAYGEYDEKLVIEVPRTQFDAETQIEVGMQFQADTAGGPTIVKVTKITDDKITVDANHDLAGKTLYFDVEIMDIRDAKPEELAAHADSCGCGCSSCGGDCGSEEDGCSCGSCC
ncbi:MAG: peptidylprolyl isomerase [Treponema sp.]|jgi:FKBP-type peptidyl-prolyl cis-trans isomerase SlyD|nr:peptidylprolyl isomerase [Treponema sp.]